MRFLNPCALGMLALSCALPLGGCSNAAPGAKTTGPIVGNGATVSQPVSPQGGTVTLQGSSITIPPGALAGNETISIQSTTSTPPAGVTNLSPIYQFGPAGLVFNKPVTIQLNFITNGNTPAFAWTNPNSTTFGILPSTVSGTAVSAQVTHFSQGFVADGTTVSNLPTGTEDAGPPTGEDSGATTDATVTTTVDATVPETDAATPEDSGEVTKDSGPTTSEDSSTPVDAGSAGDGSPCAVCSNGFCEPACQAGSVTCPGSPNCVSIESDPSNCGGCGISCDGGACVSGACTVSCYGRNSGGACGEPEQPDGGINCAACGTGFEQCGSQCVQTTTDPNNCGTCGIVCGNGEICSAGTCAPICPGGGFCAGGACVSACPTGTQVCTAPASGGTGLCTDVQTDPSHCGGCGTTCGDTQQCVGGTCVASCNGESTSPGGSCDEGTGGSVPCTCKQSPGTTACDTAGIDGCFDLQTSDLNCGACGNTCTAGQTCTSGACVSICPGTDVCTTSGVCATSCPAGQSACNPLDAGSTSNCNDLQSDPGNCGACGKACGAGQSCSGGKCVETCGGGFTADAGVPTDAGGSGGSDSGSCVSLGCQSCGETIDNCGNPISCTPCSGGDAGCVSTGCQPGMCGKTIDNCGNVIGCGPCGGGDAGPPVDASAPFDGGSCTPPSCPPDSCESLPNPCNGPPIECTSGCGDDAGPPSDGGLCVPLGCQFCGETIDNCGNPINCFCGDAGPSDGGLPPEDGGSCTPPSCPPEACGSYGNPCGGPPIECFGGCGDSGLPSDGGAPSDAGLPPEDGGSCTPPSCPPEACGSYGNPCGGPPIECTAGCGDAGLPPPSDGGAPTDGGSCKPPSCPPIFCGSLPNSCGGPPIECTNGCADDGGAIDSGGPSCGAGLLSNPIVPTSQIAGVNINAQGTETVSYAFFAQTNCAGNSTAVNTGDTGVNAYTWGPEGDIYAEFNQTTNDLYFLQLTGGYTGTVSFHSRPAGAFGSHTYTLGLNTIQRDGKAITIDWSSSANADLVINELYDGMMATFAPSFPVIPDCGADGACLIVPNDGSDTDGGPGNSIFGIRPLKMYFQMPGGTSSVNLIYTFVVPPTGGTESDGGAIPGTSGDGGLPSLGNGCLLQGSVGGTCETPTSDLCSNHPGTEVVSCQNDPLSGYFATCCPDDGG